MILGGGFVAIGAVKPFKRAIRDGKVDVTVVDRENYHFYHGIISEFVLGRIGSTNVLSPLRRVLKPAKLHVAEIEAIDLDNKKVVTSRSLDGRRQELSYDHLVFGLGSVDNLDLYPGLAEHAFKLKAYDDCFRLKNHILTMFELASIEGNPEEKRALLTFFIAGGGFAGSEIAGELADFARRLAGNEFPDVSRDECRVVLVQPGPHILPELWGSGEKGIRGYPKLVEFAERHVAELGVEVMTETYVAAASPHSVTLSNGERIRTNTIISAVGTKMPPILDDLDLPRGDRDRLPTDRNLNIEGRTDLWAGGDDAAVPDPAGGLSPPRALPALHHGVCIAKNILRTLDGAPLKAYSYRPIGLGVPLGGRKAVGTMKGLPLRGTTAWFSFKVALLLLTPTLDRRLRILSDWILVPFIGRDIVESSIADADDYELRQDLFQPGEIIFTEGRGGRYTHVIMEGEVELLHRHDGTEEVVTTVGPGTRIGGSWFDEKPDESARAKTAVRTVAVRTDQSREVQHLITSLSDIAEPGDKPPRI